MDLVHRSVQVRLWPAKRDAHDYSTDHIRHIKCSRSSNGDCQPPIKGVELELHATLSKRGFACNPPKKGVS